MPLRMGLSEYKLAAGVPVSDMNRTSKFYEGKFSLLVGVDSGNNGPY